MDTKMITLRNTFMILLFVATVVWARLGDVSWTVSILAGLGTIDASVWLYDGLTQGKWFD